MKQVENKELIRGLIQHCATLTPRLKKVYGSKFDLENHRVVKMSLRKTTVVKVLINFISVDLKLGLCLIWKRLRL